MADKAKTTKNKTSKSSKDSKGMCVKFFFRMVSYYNLLYLSVKLVKANITTTTDLKQRWVDLS